MQYSISCEQSRVAAVLGNIYLLLMVFQVSGAIANIETKKLKTKETSTRNKCYLFVVRT